MTIQELLSFDDILKIEALNRRQDTDGNDFCFHTCCDYVDSLVVDGDRYGVVVFVEPCGNITKWDSSWGKVLDWWIKVFETQPDYQFGYIEAGHHLMDLFDSNTLPDDPQECWPIILESSAAPNKSLQANY